MRGNSYVRSLKQQDTGVRRLAMPCVAGRCRHALGGSGPRLESDVRSVNGRQGVRRPYGQDRRGDTNR